MLILTRIAGETVLIGENIRIMVAQVRGKQVQKQVRLRIEAPPDQLVLRKEVKPDSEKKPKVTSS